MQHSALLAQMSLFPGAAVTLINLVTTHAICNSPVLCRDSIQYADVLHVGWPDPWGHSWLHHGIPELCR